jgi:hypothetical protein
LQEALTIAIASNAVTETTCTPSSFTHSSTSHLAITSAARQP